VALKLENEFVVNAPVEATWKTLLDLQRVAGCLPGATIEAPDAEGTYAGAMRVKVGPVSMNYAGTARLEDVDESAHTAVFTVKGKETRGQGSATARIRNRLVPEGEGTRVVVETELSVTGRPAQFGRGIMQDVASSMLDDFARCLSTLMAASAEAVEPEAPQALVVGGHLRKAAFSRLRAFFGRVFGRHH
jgi:carbon monoxide dehydrogenase subunit G